MANQAELNELETEQRSIAISLQTAASVLQSELNTPGGNPDLIRSALVSVNAAAQKLINMPQLQASE
jgi:hypothetical protein